MTTPLLISISIIAAMTVAMAWLCHKMHTLEQEKEQLRQERDEAICETVAKEKFIHNLSHEIRTPLNAVTGFAQLLSLPAECLSDSEREEYKEYVMHNSSMLIMLVDDILNISDIKEGNYTIHLQRQSPDSICNTSLQAVKYRVTSDVTLKYESSLPDDFTINCDQQRIQQILINYLTNAIKHTKHGTITLSASTTERPGHIIFAVTDTGEGVPPGKAEEIFHRFSKFNDMIEGSGIGLNICLTLAEKMGGEVYLDESYTGGARFVFSLPL